MSFKFKGYDWTELADCWGIEVETSSLIPLSMEDGQELKELTIDQTEKIDVSKYVNGMKVVFTVEDEEEVLAEKIKRHIRSKLIQPADPEEQNQIRKEMNDFLSALIKESKKRNYNAPAIEGILAIKSNHTFAQWFCHNLESLWS